jgi:hypothetical protein
VPEGCKVLHSLANTVLVVNMAYRAI